MTHLSVAQSLVGRFDMLDNMILIAPRNPVVSDIARTLRYPKPAGLFIFPHIKNEKEVLRIAEVRRESSP